MTQVLPVPIRHSDPSQPHNIVDKAPRLPPTLVTIPQSGTSIRNGHLNLDIFSPVNQNGSFEFDKVLKSGEVYKRTRKTRVSARIVLFNTGSLLIESDHSNGRDII